jgi:hypothetical protein
MNYEPLEIKYDISFEPIDMENLFEKEKERIKIIRLNEELKYKETISKRKDEDKRNSLNKIGYDLDNLIQRNDDDKYYYDKDTYEELKYEKDKWYILNTFYEGRNPEYTTKKWEKIMIEKWNYRYRHGIDIVPSKYHNRALLQSLYRETLFRIPFTSLRQVVDPKLFNSRRIYFKYYLLTYYFDLDTMEWNDKEYTGCKSAYYT